MAASSTPTPRLIAPADRARFVAAYVCVTIVLWVLFGVLFSFPPLNSILNATVRVVLDAVATGLCVGIGQWFVLRPYIPTKAWIAATTIGASLAALTQHLWYTALLQALQNPDSSFLEIFSQSPLGVLLPLQGMTILAFCVWFAGAQWLVLRRYVKASVGWLFTPAIGAVLSWIILLLQLALFFVLRQPLLSDRILFPGMIAAAQALMLCRFHRKAPKSEPLATEATAPQEPGLLSSIGLAIGTIFGVVILGISMQGFLIVLGV